MARLRQIALGVLACAMFGAAGAETLTMDRMAADSSVQRPARGMTQAGVESRFGTPVSRVAPVGDPPISRWHYRDFIVYFEHDRVIHAVIKR